MLYYFRMISNEVEDFVFEFAISDQANFFDLHQFIQSKLNYDPHQLASFFITDNQWNKQTEITLMDMGEHPDLQVMEKSIIADFIASNKQRMLYVFDLFNERTFFLEIFDITNQTVSSPELIKMEGTPPTQIEIENLLMAGEFMNDEFELEEEIDEFFNQHEEMDDDFDFGDFSIDRYQED